MQNENRRLTAPDIRARKGGEPIVALTSYHAHTARILDAYCDVILVGDSLGMVMHGLETTVPVTLEMMILQGHAVMRGSKRALVVIDMPFGSYEASKEQAFASAARVLKETGCGSIKIEGGRRLAETITFLVERGVPVMGHVGLTPQAINTLGSFRAQGRDEIDWAPIEADARAVAEAGAFAVVLDFPTPEYGLSLVVHCLQLQPYVKGIDCSAGEKVADLASAHHNIDAHIVAAPDGGIHPVHRSGDRPGLAGGTRRQARFGFFAHGERRR